MIQVKKIFSLGNELQMIKLRSKYRYHHYHYYISCVAYETFFITSIFELFSIMGYITKKNAIFERNIY